MTRATMTTPHILLVEDNPGDSNLITAFCAVAAPHLAFTIATTGTDGQSLLDAGQVQFAAIVIDYILPDTNGLALLQEIVHSAYPAPVVIITARSDVQTAVAAMQAGASDYLLKNANYWESLPRVIESAIERDRLTRENQRLRTELEAKQADLEQAFARVQHERDRLQTVLDYLPEGVILVSEQERQPIIANRTAARLFGIPSLTNGNAGDTWFYRQEALDGTPLAPEDTPAMRVFRLGEPVLGEQVVMVQPDGNRITTLVNAAPLYDEQNNVQDVVVVFQDISKLKRLERIKDEILSIASHELKNPLTVIMGYSSLLLRSPAVEHDARIRRAAETILHQSQRMRWLINRLLDFSRLQLGQMILQHDVLDLVKLLHTVVEDQQEAAKQHVLHLQVEHDTIVIKGDQMRLEQVLVNLIDNAIKYSPNGGDIEVSLSVQQSVSLPETVFVGQLPHNGPFVLVQVRDHGIGIEQDRQPQLFTQFHRTEEAAQLAAGQGLGLFISAEIVQRHGGVLGVASTPGKGSIFSLILPLETNDK